MRYILLVLSIVALLGGSWLLAPKTRFDKVEPGYHEVQQFMYQGVHECSAEPTLRPHPVPLFSFSLAKYGAFAGMQPTSVMFVDRDTKPEILVVRNEDGKNSIIVVVSKSEPWANEIPEDFRR
ncbi:MAG: hypothetical protein V1895_03745 [Parcubacteria group bacterium]